MPAHDAPEDVAQQIADLIVRVHEIHDGIIRQTGGLEGLRDGGMLHAAVARPFAPLPAWICTKTTSRKRPRSSTP